MLKTILRAPNTTNWRATLRCCGSEAGEGDSHPSYSMLQNSHFTAPSARLQVHSKLFRICNGIDSEIRGRTRRLPRGEEASALSSISSRRIRSGEVDLSY